MKGLFYNCSKPTNVYIKNKKFCSEIIKKFIKILKIMKKYFIILFFSLISILNINANDVKYHFNMSNIETKLNNNIIFKDSIINKVTPIERYLDIKEDQRYFFKDVHEDIYNSIHKFALTKEDGKKEFIMHLNNGLRNSRIILNKEQMKKYLIVLNVTLINNDLSKYISND